eukprot:640526-Prorocentrum_minimum.AAC.1
MHTTPPIARLRRSLAAESFKGFGARRLFGIRDPTAFRTNRRIFAASPPAESGGTRPQTPSADDLVPRRYSLPLIHLHVRTLRPLNLTPCLRAAVSVGSTGSLIRRRWPLTSCVCPPPPLPPSTTMDSLSPSRTQRIPQVLTLAASRKRVRQSASAPTVGSCAASPSQGQSCVSVRRIERTVEFVTRHRRLHWTQRRRETAIRYERADLERSCPSSQRVVGRGRPVLPAAQRRASYPVDHPYRGPLLARVSIADRLTSASGFATGSAPLGIELLPPHPPPHQARGPPQPQPPPNNNKLVVAEPHTVVAKATAHRLGLPSAYLPTPPQQPSAPPHLLPAAYAAANAPDGAPPPAPPAPV